MVKLEWMPRALSDLLDIYVHIVSHDPNAAERYLDRIEAKAARLIAYPRSGPRR